jgi:tetratricopeptide (TPR) repeat protein
MKLGWFLASVVLLALLAAPVHAAGDDLADEFSVSNESNPVEWYNKGDALSNLGRNDEALDCYEKAIDLDPNFVYAWSGKGWALSNLGRNDEALDCYEKAIDLDPNFMYAWSGKGWALSNLDRNDEALDCYEKAIDLDPNFVNAWSGKGWALSNLDRNDEALDCYEKAIDLDSNFVNAWSGKGDALGNLGKYDKALDCYEKAIDLDPNFMYAWSGKGWALGNLGKFDEALDCYEKAIDLDPNFMYAWSGNGWVLGNLGKYDKALNCFEKAIDLDPNCVYAWSGKGWALGNLDRNDEALDFFEKAIDLDPNFVYAWSGKGDALYNLNQTEKALENYNKAIQLDSKIPTIWYNKGATLESLNRSNEAAMAYSLGRERELSSEEKMGIFAAFLFALVAGGYALSRLFRKYKILIVILSVNLLGFLTFMWVLSGLFDFTLVKQFLAGGVLMIGISAALWSFSGFPLDPWMTQLVLAIEYFEKRCPSLSWTIRAVGLLAVLAYIGVAVRFYFRFHLDTELSMVHFLEFAFVSIFLVGLFVTLPPIWAAMLSKNLDRGTRDILLIFQFGHLGITGLYLGLILWIFEIGSFDHSVQLGNIKFPISPHFLGIMMSLFLLAILIPYISGSKRASMWTLALLGKERYWLDELLDILDYPTPSLYVPKLQKILDGIKDDDMISGQDGELNRIESLYDADALRLDPRFCYSGFLMRHQDRIAENIDQFKELKGDGVEIKETARIYAEAYRFRRDEIAGMIEREGQFKPRLWVALAIILTPILGQILASLINWILKAMIETNLGGLIISIPASPLP